MTWRVRDLYIGAPVITDTDTVQKVPLGTILHAYDPVYGDGEFIYLKGVASTIVGSAALYNPDDWSTTLAVAASKGGIGIAMSINVANQYGWYQISGKGIVSCNGAVVDDADVYLTATAGKVDDAVVAGSRMKNAKFASADTSSLAEIELWRPFVDAGAAA